MAEAQISGDDQQTLQLQNTECQSPIMLNSSDIISLPPERDQMIKSVKKQKMTRSKMAMLYLTFQYNEQFCISNTFRLSIDRVRFECDIEHG